MFPLPLIPLLLHPRDLALKVLRLDIDLTQPADTIISLVYHPLCYVLRPNSVL